MESARYKSSTAEQFVWEKVRMQRVLVGLLVLVVSVLGGVFGAILFYAVYQYGHVSGPLGAFPRSFGPYSIVEGPIALNSSSIPESMRGPADGYTAAYSAGEGEPMLHVVRVMDSPQAASDEMARIGREAEQAGDEVRSEDGVVAIARTPAGASGPPDESLERGEVFWVSGSWMCATWGDLEEARYMASSLDYGPPPAASSNGYVEGSREDFSLYGWLYKTNYVAVIGFALSFVVTLVVTSILVALLSRRRAAFVRR